MELVILASGVVPLGMGILAEIGDLLVGDVAVCEEIGDVLVLWSVGGVKLVGVEFEAIRGVGLQV